MSRFRGFSNNFKKRKREEVFPVLEQFPNPFAETQANTELTELTRRLGDEKLAKRVLALQQEYPNGTVPELCCMDWLQTSKHTFIYQGMLYGGRAAMGGLVPDFVVDVGALDGMAWQIQGDYWHGQRSVEKQFRDQADNMRLLGQIVGGIRIGKVLGLWESDIYSRRELVFQYALAGLSLR
jgi:hypothetical protein